MAAPDKTVAVTAWFVPTNQGRQHWPWNQGSGEAMTPEVASALGYLTHRDASLPGYYVNLPGDYGIWCPPDLVLGGYSADLPGPEKYMLYVLLERRPDITPEQVRECLHGLQLAGLVESFDAPYWADINNRQLEVA